jgi:hypothetical protein
LILNKFSEKGQEREKDLKEGKTPARDMCWEDLNDGDGTFNKPFLYSLKVHIYSSLKCYSQSSCASV